MGMTVASFQEAGICPLFHMLLNSPKRTLRTFTGSKNQVLSNLFKQELYRNINKLKGKLEPGWYHSDQCAISTGKAAEERLKMPGSLC